LISIDGDFSFVMVKPAIRFGPYRIVIVDRKYPSGELPLVGDEAAE
jgi:hypothetical protein